MQKYKKGDFFHFPNKSVLRGLDSKAQVVFMWLSSYADESGVCFPSRKTLAQDTGIKSPKTIDRAIKVLEDKKLISKEARFENKKQKSNNYQINSLGGVKFTPTPGQNLPPPQCKIYSQNSLQLNSKDKKKKTTRKKTFTELEKIREKMKFRKRSK